MFPCVSEEEKVRPALARVPFFTFLLLFSFGCSGHDYSYFFVTIDN